MKQARIIHTGEMVKVQLRDGEADKWHTWRTDNTIGQGWPRMFKDEREAKEAVRWIHGRKVEWV